MIYLYAITEAAAKRPATTGLRDAPVRYLESGALRAAVSDWGGAEPELTAETAWAHERVVEQLMSYGPVLPVRFGTVLGTDDQIVGELGVRRVALEAKLELVRGAVELGVRGVWMAPDQAPPTGEDRGKEYLGAIARRARLAESVDRPLASIARASRKRAAARGGFAGAYLVDLAQADVFRARVEALREMEGVELTCTGPWPPYSFVERGGAVA